MYFQGATSSSKCQGERSITRSFKRHQLVAQMDTPFRQTAGKSQRQLLVASHNLAAGLHRPGSDRTPHLVWRAKQVHQIESTLLTGIQTVETATGSLQQMTHWHIMTALDILLNPLIHTKMIEPRPFRGTVRIARRETRFLELLF